jgi:branched-chain amino acid transport system ATP-binding protein
VGLTIRKPSTTMADSLLRVESLLGGYGRIEVLRDVSLRVDEGEIVALVGANGAGKTTLLKTLSGVLRPTRGEVVFDGESIAGASPVRLVRRGLVHVPEGRELFGPLAVEDNLRLGLYARYVRGWNVWGGYFGYLRDRPAVRQRLEEVFERFPILRERRRQAVATLSGGQQQMVATGRALMATPRLLMLDEPSLGLAPLVEREIMRGLRTLREAGVTMLLVEQDAHAALAIADRAYVMEDGRIVAEGPAAELRADPAIRDAYLGGKVAPAPTVRG